jgi:hypothetical protein
VDQDKEFLDLKAQVAAQAAEIAQLKARMEGSATPTSVERVIGESDGQTSRRQLFKLAGAAAAGAAGASLLSAQPAGATVGTMFFGTVNDSGTDGTELRSTAGNSLFVENDGGGVAVTGVALVGPGLRGSSGGSYGVVGQGALAPLLLTPAPAQSGPPTTDTHRIGEFFVDTNGVLFQCVGGGTPGTWVRVGFNPLTPVRILDTRNGIGPLGAGQTANLTVGGNNGVPIQASAVVMNVTIAEPTAAGYLTIWPEGVALPLASNLNWVAGQVVANMATVKLGTGSGISILNGASGTVQVILDLAGFFS